jgi:hypothetical protein
LLTFKMGDISQCKEPVELDKAFAYIYQVRVYSYILPNLIEFH